MDRYLSTLLVAVLLRRAIATISFQHAGGISISEAWIAIFMIAAGLLAFAVVTMVLSLGTAAVYKVRHRNRPAHLILKVATVVTAPIAIAAVEWMIHKIMLSEPPWAALITALLIGPMVSVAYVLWTPSRLPGPQKPSRQQTRGGTDHG